MSGGDGIAMNVRSPTVLNMPAIMVVAALGYINCKGAPQSAQLTFQRGVVKINGKKVKIGATLVAGDRIEAGDKTLAVVQFGKVGVVSLHANSKLAIFEFDGVEFPQIRLGQSAGSTFHRVVAEAANYSVSSPAFAATTSGARFAVDVGKKSKGVSVLQGKVTVTPRDLAEVELNDREKVVVGDSPTQISKRSFSLLKLLSQIKIVPAGKGNPVPRSVEHRFFRKKSSGLTLAAILAEYGKLSEVHTRSGEKYVGGYRSGSGQMELQTRSGMMYIPLINVAKVLPYELKK